ncbi:MAG: alpha-galactosidase, partial [Eubacterium sp.]|nr:alpha-galactosidase [Eubacterium sp.]
KADHLCANANMWRLTGDFWDVWDKLYDMFDRCKEWEGVTAPGNFPDCDMLPIGRIAKNSTYYGANNRMSQFTVPEHYTLMTLWGIFRSPLMIGGNLPENDDFTLSLLTNSEYMNMNQNSRNARELCRNGDKVIWASDGEGCSYAALFNTGDKEQEVTMPLDGECSVYDIWQKADLGSVQNTLVATVAPHGARLFKIKYN